MSRFMTRSMHVVLDALVLSVALWLAFLFRFDWVLPLQMLKRALFTWPYVVTFQYTILYLFGVPRFAWRYVGLRESMVIFAAASAFTTVLLVIRLIAGRVQDSFGYAQYALLPIGVIVIDYTLGFLGIVGIRVLRRVIAEHSDSERRRDRSVEAVPTMLVGAGQGGVLVAKEIASRPDIAIRPVGFIDDDPAKQGTVIHGIHVRGTTADLARQCSLHGATQVLITIASAAGKDIRRITQLCEQAGLPAKIIPGLYEIVGGKVNMSRIRPVAIEDLLGREAVHLDEDAISTVVRGRSVLVTGAGGSIGSELCRQVCRFEPKRLVLVDRAENNLFQIHRDLIARAPGLELIPCIADIADLPRMRQLFVAHEPQVVFHAAAHKHVPMMEWNPGEAIKNNVLGTKTLADMAHDFHVGEFVMISTDKAVNPSSVMGATKRVAEMYIQALSQKSPTRFVAVRFGNVLGSAGSVIPIFQEQIACGGPVTVTHPKMKRYFMTIPEACQLVLQAATMGEGGEIFILDMGQPVEIVELARDLIRLSGLRPEEDIEIRYTGIRPGEKLFEELAVADERAEKTRHPKIFVGKLQPCDLDGLVQKLGDLRMIVEEGRLDATVDALKALVPEYQAPDAPAQASPSPAAAAQGRA